MTLPTDYVDGDVLTAADVNAITTAVNGTIPFTTFAAKGDLLVGLTNDSGGVLSVGTNGYLLSASSGATAGVAWVPSGGKLLQFAYDSDTTSRTITSSTEVDVTGMSLTFTPVSASSTLVIDLVCTAEVELISSTDTDRSAYIFLTETGVQDERTRFGRILDATSSNANASFSPIHIRMILPSTGTAARTFKATAQVAQGGLSLEIRNSVFTGTISVMEIAS